MKNKKLTFITAVLPVLLLFSACSTTEEMKNDQSAPTVSTPTDSLQAATSSGSYQSVLSKNLIVDAVVEDPGAKALPILSVHERKFDDPKVTSVFFNGQQVSTEQGDGMNRYTSGETLLDISNEGHIRFTTGLGQYTRTLFNNGSDNNRFTDKELSGLSREKAIEQVTALMKKLDITPHLPPKVYALDFESLKDKQNSLTQDEDFMYFVNIGKVKLKDRWTQEDESYYLVFEMEANGLRVSSSSYILKNSEIKVQGSRVIAIVSKAGVQSFEVDGALYTELGKKKEASLITMEQALEALKQKYDEIIVNEELTVKHISLIYAPVIIGGSADKQTGEIINKEMELTPAWAFTIDSKYVKGNKEYMNTSVVQINAVTGKELL